MSTDLFASSESPEYSDMKPTHYCIKCGEMATLAELYHAKDDLYWCLKCLTDADGEHTGNAEKMMPLTPDDESDCENAEVCRRHEQPEKTTEKPKAEGDCSPANCSACGDKLRDHEDESATHCRWCVTGWTPCDESDCEQNSGESS